MFVYTNPHPKGLHTDDCVKRAIVLTTGKDYKEVQRELNQLKNRIGAKHYNDGKVWKHYMKENNFIKLSFPAVAGEPRMDGHRFVEEYKSGAYILHMAKHLVAVVDGNLLDTWDSRDKCVYNAFKVR